VYRTNLGEENEEELTFGANEIRVPLKAFGIATIRIEPS